MAEQSMSTGRKGNKAGLILPTYFLIFDSSPKVSIYSGRYYMSAVLEKLEHEALSLSRQERAFLADRLTLRSCHY